MIASTLLTLPQEIHNERPTILLACTGIGIALIVAIVLFVGAVITAQAKSSLRNDLE